MSYKNFNLKKIINIKKWQKVQDEIALVTKMAIILVDYKGIPMTEHSYCQEFCKFIRKDPEMSKNCQKCDSRGGLEAVRINKPYIYLCHFNIIDIAIPIVIDGIYIGALMAGQVLLDQDGNIDCLERMPKPKNIDTFVKNKYLKEYYEKLPKLTFDEINTTSNMLFSLCHYLVEEAINKNDLIEMYENLLQRSDDFTAYSLDAMVDLKTKVSKSITERQLNKSNEDNKFYGNSILKPAIDYIFNNKKLNVTLDDMANLCHISSSYFSRLFLSEMGENFSTYKSRLKIEWAKKLLETTDKTVSEISSDLGFNDGGYFIKVFKKMEGVTPSMYRKYLK